MYHFSEFTVSLNEMEENIAPTDSRLRKDQQLMEETLWDEANAEKQVLFFFYFIAYSILSDLSKLREKGGKLERVLGSRFGSKKIHVKLLA